MASVSLLPPPPQNCSVVEGQWIGVRGVTSTNNRWVWGIVIKKSLISNRANQVFLDILDRRGPLALYPGTVVRLPNIVRPLNDGWRGREVTRDAHFCTLRGYQT